MVDVFKAIFVVALEGGLFVLPCSAHVVCFLHKCLTRHGCNRAGGTRFCSLQDRCKSLTEQDSSKRQSGTPCSCSGSFCCRILFVLSLLPHPVRGGRSFAGVPAPTGASQSQSGSFCQPGLPGEGVGPKRKTKRFFFARALDLCVCAANCGVFVCPLAPNSWLKATSCSWSESDHELHRTEGGTGSGKRFGRNMEQNKRHGRKEENWSW